MQSSNQEGNPAATLLDDLLIPAGGLQGPLFASLLRRLSHSPPELPSGEQIGPYRVVSTMGRGGMATVYLAERADGEFEQRVALKLVTPGGDAQAARELLRRERQILASLQHPHIARLLDGGTSEDGLLWFAMEPIEGQRIDRYCAARALPVRARLALFMQVCAALRFAHARLLVHRDIKPSNILVTADGEVKLLDFGIATVLQAEGELASTPLALTPGFASPEQRRGEPATTASDIWQLGRLLEFLLEPAVPVPKRAPHPDTDLSAIFAKARHDDPTQRYESVAELALDIDRYLARHPVAARNGGMIYRARLFVTRHAWASAIAGVALSSAAAMATHFTVQLAQQRDAAAREAERANAATAFLINQFGDADPGVNRGLSMTADQILTRATDRLHTELADKPALRARLLQAIAKIHMSLGEPARAKPLIDEAVAELRVLAELERFALADALQVQGVIALQLGHPQEALTRFDESSRLNDSITPAAQLLRLQTLDVRSMAQIGTGQFDSALRTQLEAVAMARKVYGEDSMELAASLYNLAIAWRANGKPQQTTDAFEQAWTLYRSIHPADHPQVVGAQKNYALALLDQGKIEQARPLLEESVEMQRQLYQGRGQHYAGALRGLGNLYAAQGDWPKAIAHYQRSETLLIEALGAESLALTYTLHDLGNGFAASRDAATALSYYQRCLAIRRKLMPAGHPSIGGSLSASAGQLLLLRRYAEAEAAAEEALILFRARGVAMDPMVTQALLRLGSARFGQGRSAEADAVWDEALLLIEQSAGRDSAAYRAAQETIDAARSAAAVKP